MDLHDRNLLVMFAIALGIFLVLNLGLFLKQGPTGFASVNGSNSAPFWVSGVSYFGVSPGSGLVLDLDGYFADADGDDMSFIATQPSNFTVSISGSVLSLVPDPGFIGTRPVTITASDGAGIASQTILVDVLESAADITDANDKFYGKKITDEPSFETHFSSIENTGSQLTIVFYHDSAAPQDIWVEGDVAHALTKSSSAPLEEVTLVVQLMEGIVPRFKLHVGAASEVFEFGKEIPVLEISGGNYSLVDRDDELLDVEITKQDAAAVIRGTSASVIKAGIGAVDYPALKTDVFAAENVSMEEAVISLPALGDVNAILECPDFDVDSFVCKGSWQKTAIPFTRSGNDVVFTVDHFSGYAGGFIHIINVQSYPTINGNWTVRFNTTGTANLSIIGAAGTHFTVDLQFLELRCGNHSVNASYDGNQVFVANFSCNDTAYETSRVITGGRHHLNFTFGNSSAVAHNIVVIGANNVTTVLNATFFAENPADSAGRAVALGDINGDNTTDLIVGAPNRNESGRAYPGKVYLVYGNFTAGTRTNLSNANASWIGANNFSFAGFSLALADFNNDSLKDIVIGAYGDNTSGVFRAGTVYVIDGGNLSGSNVLLPSAASHVFTGSNASGNFGWSVAAGDLNNDSILDIAIGEPQAFVNNGAVYVFFGPLVGNYTSAMANAVFVGTGVLGPLGRFGSALAIGDINGDGANDLSIGASATFLGTGGVFTFYGPLAAGTLPDLAANIPFSGEAFGDFAGFSLSSGKDVNNDTIDDLLIGAPLFDFTPPLPIVNNTGKVYLFYGRPAWPPIVPMATANASWYGVALNDTLGVSVLLSFEDNDTLADVVMGAPGNDRGALDAGSVYFRYAPIPNAAQVNVSTVNGSLFGTFANGGLGSALGSGSLGAGAANVRWGSGTDPSEGNSAEVYVLGIGRPVPPPRPRPPGGGGFKGPEDVMLPCDPKMFDELLVEQVMLNDRPFVKVSGSTSYPGTLTIVLEGIGSVQATPRGGAFSGTIKWDDSYSGSSVNVLIMKSSLLSEENICVEEEKELCSSGRLEKESFVFPEDFYARNSVEWFATNDGDIYAIFNILPGSELPDSAVLEYCPSLFGDTETVEKNIIWAVPDSRQVYPENLCSEYCLGYYYAAAEGAAQGSSGPASFGSMPVGFGGIVLGGAGGKEQGTIGYAEFAGIPKLAPSTGIAFMPAGARSDSITGMAAAGQLAQRKTENPSAIIDGSDFGEVTQECSPLNHGEGPPPGPGPTPVPLPPIEAPPGKVVPEVPGGVVEGPGLGEEEYPPRPPGWPAGEPWPPINVGEEPVSPPSEGGEGAFGEGQDLAGKLGLGEDIDMAVGPVPEQPGFALPEIMSRISCMSNANCAAGTCSSGLCVNPGMPNPNAYLKETNAFFGRLLSRVYENSWILNADYGAECADAAYYCAGVLGAGNGVAANSITGSAVVNAKPSLITGSAVAGSCGAQAQQGSNQGSYGCGSGYGAPPAGGAVGHLSMVNNYNGVPKHCGEGLIICSPCPMAVNPRKTPEVEQPENPTPGQFKKPCPGLVPFCGVDGTAYLLYVDKNGLRDPVGFTIPDLKPVEPGLLSTLLALPGSITGGVVAGTEMPQGSLVDLINALSRKVYTSQEIAGQYCVEEDTYCASNGRCLGKCPKAEPPGLPPGPTPSPPPVPPRPGPPPEIPGPPLPPAAPPVPGAVDTRDVDNMPDDCSVVSWNRKGSGIAAKEFAGDVAVPEGYELIAGPVSFDCFEDDLDISFNVPGNYKDIRAFRCTGSSCRPITDISVNADELVCGGVPMSEYRRQQMLASPAYLPMEEIKFIEKYEALVSSARKSLSTQGYVFEFTGKIPSGVVAGLFSPDFDVPLAANPSITIISTPLVVEFDMPLPEGVDARVTLPYQFTEGIDEDSIAVYLLQEDGRWMHLDSAVDKNAKTASASLYDIAKYLKDSRLVFAAMAVRCEACIVSKFEQVYAPGSRDAIILVHGLTSSSKTWQFLIDDYVFNKQPWQIWTFDYPSYRTVDEMAKDLADSMQAHNAEFDNIYIVGHSLGSFIGQRALEIADADPAVYSFVRKVRKLIVAGNPGKGSPAAEVYDTLFNELINLKSVAQTFDLNSLVIKDLVQGRQFLRVPGVKYYVIAGSKTYEFNLGLFTLTTGGLFKLAGINDGIVTTESASFVGGEFVKNACKDYFEIKLTHTELIDETVPRRIIARIIAEDKASEEPGYAYVGYNKYVSLLVDRCAPEEYFMVVGKRMPVLESPAPLNCNCGNGVCGEGEDYDSCPQDCAGVFSLASLCMMLPVLIILLLLLLAVLVVVYIIKRRVQKKDVSVVWRAGLWFLILLIIVLVLLVWFVCRYLPWWYLIVLALAALALILDSAVPWEPKREDLLEEMKKRRLSKK